MIVRLGNDAAKDANGALPGKHITTVNIPDSYTLAEAFVCITAADGVWKNHSDGSALWVDSDSPGLSTLLAEHFGCEVGAPDEDELERNYHTYSGPPTADSSPEEG